jgi:hypothetical protein
MLLVDSGRFAYSGTDLSATLQQQYARYARAHNTITIDGCDQLPFPAVATEPVPAASVQMGLVNDTAYGTMADYDGLLGNASHTRAVYFSRQYSKPGSDDGDWIIVIDAIETDRPRSIQLTWHAHPNASQASLEGLNAVVGGANARTGEPLPAQICVIPAPTFGANPTWSKAEIVRGVYQNASTGALWQGWFSPAYDSPFTAPALVYDGNIETSTVFAWFLVPTASPAACVASIDIKSIDANEVTVAVSVNGEEPKIIVVELPFTP